VGEKCGWGFHQFGGGGRNLNGTGKRGELIDKVHPRGRA